MESPKIEYATTVYSEYPRHKFELPTSKKCFKDRLAAQMAEMSCDTDFRPEGKGLKTGAWSTIMHPSNAWPSAVARALLVCTM